MRAGSLCAPGSNPVPILSLAPGGPSDPICDIPGDMMNHRDMPRRMLRPMPKKMPRRHKRVTLGCKSQIKLRGERKQPREKAEWSTHEQSNDARVHVFLCVVSACVCVLSVPDDSEHDSHHRSQYELAHRSFSLDLIQHIETIILHILYILFVLMRLLWIVLEG